MVLWLSLPSLPAGEAAPPFKMTSWQTGETVALSHFGGDILVLDFFAHWCAPCLHSSPILEKEIQRHYQEKGGNPQGLPVRVISINIDGTDPARTERFIRRTGISFAVNDEEGATLKQYGGDAIPFLVIVDGSRATPDNPAFEMVYRKAGFEGSATLRGLIDVIGRESTATLVSAAEGGGTNQISGGFPITHQIDANTELVASADIQLTQSAASYGQSIGRWDWKLTGTLKTYDEDYEPAGGFFDFFGFATNLHEITYGGQVEFRYQVSEPVQLVGGGGFYEGFEGYQAIWLDNYYKQQHSNRPGYQEASPRGYNAGGGVRWEYLPTTAILEARLQYARDDVAPGYEIETDAVGSFLRLVRGRESLDTISARVSTENVLARRVRTRLLFQLTDTTDRELRYAVQGDVNVALGNRWVWRTTAGFTEEDPTFDAWFATSTVEWEPQPSFYLSAAGHYYEDTGEIANSLQLSSAAPGLMAKQVGLGVRYMWPHVTLKVFVGPYYTRYDSVDQGTLPFVNLYTDRDWWLAQVALTVQY